MPSVALGVANDGATALAFGHSRAVALGVAVDGDQAVGMMAFKAISREAVHYAYLNIGNTVNPPETFAHHYAYLNIGNTVNPPETFAHHYAYLNVGWWRAPEPEEGVHYAYMNLDDAAPALPGKLIGLIPDYGREGWQFRIIGVGLGATRATRASVPMLGDLALSVVSWGNVAASYGADEQYINEETGETNMEHQDILVTIPTGAETGLVRVRQEDGT